MIRIAATLAVLVGLIQAGKAPSPDFDRMKALAGTWETEGMTVTYKLTSGGNTVMETLGPGTEKEMVTMYYVDGGSLVLVHYCMLGNQPRMKAGGGAKGDSIEFSCSGGSNLECARDAHMHSLTLTFQDKDHIKQEWSMYEEGKSKHAVTFALARKKG